jgi:hypothetical protein
MIINECLKTRKKKFLKKKFNTRVNEILVNFLYLFCVFNSKESENSGEKIFNL